MTLKILVASGERFKDGSLTDAIMVLLFVIAGISMLWIIRSSAITVYILYMLVIVSSIYGLNNNSDKTE